MIKQLNKARSTFNSLTGGGSYPNFSVYATGSKSYCYIREPKVEKLSRATRQARKTAAISLQANYLLGLLHKENGQENKNAGDVATAEVTWMRLPRWKRGMDLTLTLLTLPIWLVMMGFIALWIKLTSPGPVFYRQIRVGLGGQHFTILKFRSMRLDAETKTHTDHFGNLILSDGSMVKLDSLGDARVIPGGCFLRASGLDELPQLFNVLRGEMSLVGPRPCLPGEFERYEDWHKGRVCVPPGLTGYWQVSGKNKTSFKQMVELDLRYARQMSLGMDLAVILATIPTLILQFVETRNRCVQGDLLCRARATAPQAPQVVAGESEGAEPSKTSAIAA